MCLIGGRPCFCSDSRPQMVLLISQTCPAPWSSTGSQLRPLLTCKTRKAYSRLVQESNCLHWTVISPWHRQYNKKSNCWSHLNIVTECMVSFGVGMRQDSYIIIAFWCQLFGFIKSWRKYLPVPAEDNKAVYELFSHNTILTSWKNLN